MAQFQTVTHPNRLQSTEFYRHAALRMHYALMRAKPCATRLAMLCCIAACFGRISTAETSSREPTSININARRILHSIPRSIYGTFLEPIGNSTYNGLWAEILQNPSFEDNLWEAKQIAEMVRDRPELATSSGMSLPLPWEPLDYKQGARYAPESSEPANSNRSLLLMALPTEETGVRQILPPGTFIQVDESRNKVIEGGWRSEYERPIYFVETREGHTCCWCVQGEGGIVLQSHPLSPVRPKIVPNDEADIIGQVVGVAMRLGA
jgi:hypothetical protein